jgi:hypothetical protein
VTDEGLKNVLLVHEEKKREPRREIFGDVPVKNLYFFLLSSEGFDLTLGRGERLMMMEY